MLRKRETLTIITPIPSYIPRQLAIDLLHSHSEVINVNPLVLEHKPIPAPRNASSDEYYSSWYEITQRIQYVPGAGKLGSGKIKFNGCFHDMPWGLQSHIYAPMNVDMRNKYRIQGNQPGEPPEQIEIGLEELGAPKDGLYLREDIEFKCNITMMSFVKAEMRKASKDMLARLIKKAELVDAGVLKAMFQDGKLTTINPADRSNTHTQQYFRQSTMHTDGGMMSPSPGPASPALPYQQTQHSPSLPPYARPASVGAYQSPYQNPYQVQHTPPPQAPPIPPKTQQFAMELPGDYYHPASSRSPSLNQAQPSPDYRNSVNSHHSDPRWSHPQPSPGQHSPMYMVSAGQPAAPAELASHTETREEYQQDRKY